MLKVGPSKIRNPSKSAVVVVLRTIPSKININIGKKLSGEKTPASFANEIKPIVKRMIPRVLWMNGVPKDVCNKYFLKAKRPNGLKHANLLGLRDNTSCVPEGHVHIPGFPFKDLKKIFITKTPCGLATGESALFCF